MDFKMGRYKSHESKLASQKKWRDSKRDNALHAEEERVRRFFAPGKLEPDGTYWAPEYRPTSSCDSYSPF